jgi:hypothetical protein
LRALPPSDAPGIFFIFIFLRNICMNLQIKTARIMQALRVRNANKDGIFFEFICLLRVRDWSAGAPSRKTVRDNPF